MKKITVVFLFLFLVLAAGTVVFISRHQTLTPVYKKEAVLGLLEALSNQGIGVSGLPVMREKVIEASIAGKRVVFSDDGDIKSQVRALQLILPRLKMDARVSEVDLRFNKVVLR